MKALTLQQPGHHELGSALSHSSFHQHWPSLQLQGAQALPLEGAAGAATGRPAVTSTGASTGSTLVPAASSLSPGARTGKPAPAPPFAAAAPPPPPPALAEAVLVAGGARLVVNSGRRPALSSHARVSCTAVSMSVTPCASNHGSSSSSAAEARRDGSLQMQRARNCRGKRRSKEESDRDGRSERDAAAVSLPNRDCDAFVGRLIHA